MTTSQLRAAAFPIVLLAFFALLGCGAGPGTPGRPAAQSVPRGSSPIGHSSATRALSAQAGGPVRERGTLLSVEPLQHLDTTQVAEYLAGQGVDVSQVRFEVQASRISYVTVDPAGLPTTASALVTAPSPAPGRPASLERRMVSWEHGTIPARGEVASMTADSSDRAAAVLFAAGGYVVSAPDYLGLGTGPGYHPYLDLPTTVSASIDSLRATRALVARERHDASAGLDGQVLLSGHSQGGQAAMAVGKELQRGADPTLRLAAVAPIAGPYDVSATLSTAVTGGIDHASAYLAFFAVEWNRLHHLYDSPRQAFRPPYADTVTDLLDGSHSSTQVLAALPPTPAGLFTPMFLSWLMHPTGALADALAVADSSCDWRPDVPVRLFAASADRDVPIANSIYCQRQVRAAGGDAALVDLGAVDHTTSELRALPQVLAAFDQSAASRPGR